MRTIAGIFPPTSGEVNVAGHNVRREPDTARRKLGYFPEQAPYYPEMSVTGYLASCQPSSGPVEFVVLTDAKMIDSQGRLLREAGELTLCPNMLTSIALDEGPRGRDLK